MQLHGGFSKRVGGCARAMASTQPTLPAIPDPHPPCRHNFEPGTRLLLAGTIQFASSIQAAKRELAADYPSITIPQVKHPAHFHSWQGGRFSRAGPRGKGKEGRECFCNIMLGLAVCAAHLCRQGLVGAMCRIASISVGGRASPNHDPEPQPAAPAGAAAVPR